MRYRSLTLLIVAIFGTFVLACQSAGDDSNNQTDQTQQLDGGDTGSDTLLGSDTSPADTTPSPDAKQPKPDQQTGSDGQTGDNDKIQTLFSVNVHDWVYLQDSIKTLHRVIDIHEKYNVKVDIYLTDPMTQAYVKTDPTLIERFKTSKMVAMSYHVRPPATFYPDFDFVGMDTMSDSDLQSLLYRYETQKTDLVSGLPIEGTEGGYAYLKKVIGYAPLAVGLLTGNGRPTDYLEAIYKEMGAMFSVVHGTDTNYGDKRRGIWSRPEHVEIKLYEYRNGEDAKEVLEAEIKEKACPNPEKCAEKVYMNIKFHENNWYTNDTSWWPVYFEDSKKTTPKKPPFDLTASEGVIKYKSQSMQDNLWKIYEDAVKYVAENPERFKTINLLDLKQEMENDPNLQK